MSTGKPVLASQVNFEGKAEFGLRCWRMRIGARLAVLIIAFAQADFAHAEDGVPGVIGAIALTPYYHTVWFRVAALAVFVLLLLALYQIRLITRHNAELLRENSERKRAEAALKQTRAYMAESERLSLTGSFSWNVVTGEIFWSDEVFRIFEWDPSTKPTLDGVRERIHPEDLDSHDQLVERAAREMKDFEYAHRIVIPDGSIKHLEMMFHAVKDKSGTSVEYVGAARDVTERKRAEALLTGEKRLLEMIATGVPLANILDVLCRVIEEQRTGTLASVLLLRPDGQHLDSVAGPSLPREWTDQMASLPIGPCAGSCGTAAYRGSAVIVSDLATDPLWDVPEHRASALGHGLRASWSNPVLSSEGKVLGTFCMYYREPRSPNSHDLELIELATHLARVAIERDRSEEALRRSESFLADGQKISHTGTWGWNISTGEVVWSDEHFQIFGFDPETTEPSFQLFLETVHPEDQSFVERSLGAAVREKSDFDMEFRIALAGGSIKNVQGVGRPVITPAGDIDNYIGTTVDITRAQTRPAEIPRSSGPRRPRDVQRRLQLGRIERCRLALFLSERVRSARLVSGSATGGVNDGHSSRLVLAVAPNGSNVVHFAENISGQRFRSARQSSERPPLQPASSGSLIQPKTQDDENPTTTQKQSGRILAQNFSPLGATP